MNSFHRYVLALVPGLIAGLEVSTAQILITVDLSTKSGVLINTTGRFPLAGDSVTLDTDGISLLSFFSSLGPITLTPKSIVPPTLRSRGGRVYTDLGIDDTNLRLFVSASPGQAQSFALNRLAISGNLSVDMTSVASRLPAIGTTGNIVSGWSGAPGVVIGQWIAAPEPETYGMAFGAGLIGFAMWRRSRK